MPGVGTTHHVKIGTHYYLVRPGSYLKKSAPMFGARFSTGDPDLNNLSQWQHWGQRCFIGGVDAPDYTDDGMYHEGVGVDTTVHERVTLARDLKRGSGANWTIGATNPGAGYKAIIYNSLLYVLAMPIAGESELWAYTAATQSWARVTSLDAANILPRCIATFDGKLFIGGTDSGGGGPTKLVYASGALSSWTSITPPAGATSTVRQMRTFQQKLYVAFNTQIWRLKDNQTWDGNTVFYKADLNSDSNYIVSMETHLGFLYMLSQNGHVHRTDGNSTFDIWSWDGQTYGTGIKSFDGRLFISTFEFTDTAAVGYGVLYQMSGSAVTQLKRWGDELAATNIGGMIVYDRHLFYGASNLLGFGSGRAGFGIAAYDPIEDAHSIIASNGDTVTYARGSFPYTNYQVDDVIAFGGNLFAFARGHGAFFTQYKPSRDRLTGITWPRTHDTTAAGGSAVSLNGGWFTTSTYDAGTHGINKLWRKIAIDYEVPTTNESIVVDYSTNSGTSWTTIGTCNSTGGRQRKEFFLTVTSVTLKLRFTLRSTDSTKTPIFYGYVVSYITVPEPNWMWSMTLVLSESQALLDGTTAAVDTEAELTYLGGLWRAHALVPFTDAEGVNWPTAGGNGGVLIYDMTVALRDLTQPIEGEVTIVLLEAVETY